MIEVRLAELLAKHGRSRYWLANECGLKQQTISKLFKKETKAIDFATVNAICKVFDCQPSDFLVYVKDEGDAEIERKDLTVEP